MPFRPCIQHSTILRSIVLTSGLLWTCLFAGAVNAQEAQANTTTPKPRSDTQSQDVLKQEIESILGIQTEAWNRGDLEAFMSTYWKSPKLSFSSGGQTTFGWQATLNRYKKGYAPPKEMGQLHFDKLLVSSIEKRSALVLGNWHLKMKDGQKRDGNFSLVMKKVKGKWKIIHDHSSELEPEKTEE